MASAWTGIHTAPRANIAIDGASQELPSEVDLGPNVRKTADMELKDVGQVIAGVGAVLAAVFAGATWWHARSHEQTKWTRTALETAFVDFVSSWYEGMNACKQVGYMRQGRTSHLTQDEWRQVAREADVHMLSMLTRIRVLAGDETAEIARDLARHLDRRRSQVDENRTDDLLEEHASRRVRSNLDRDRFIVEARRVLKVKP